ncbi:hypothetical protein EJ06DRAFT_525534 [Trichodelitschia bisporula]|uniref:Uncharacterized protein n=1 Tax=Trichodelitschia bisporula TaxID=703511 RepID=A0A6G1I9H5_9PEZI|nr:hypothetical protein EJ06DRAFT_525534 [Trichodelitschia bisporula]
MGGEGAVVQPESGGGDAEVSRCLNLEKRQRMEASSPKVWGCQATSGSVHVAPVNPKRPGIPKDSHETEVPS